METTRLYYQDAYLKKTTVEIVDQRESKDGIWLLADKTISYPGGGGQDADITFFNHYHSDKVKTEQESIWYHFPSGTKIPDKKAEMTIDWSRRHYNMQQHTGQHVLSSVLAEEGFPTVSVHLGEEYTLVEVDGPSFEPTLLDTIELKSNDIIRSAFPVETFWITPEQANKYPLRRPPKDWDKLRLVQIQNCDLVACGGTHVKNTAEIGYIKLAGIEKIRGHFRIKAFIGNRADRYFSQLHETHTYMKSAVQADLETMVERVDSLVEERNHFKRKSDKLVSYYLSVKADELTRKNRLDNGIVYFRMDPDEESYTEELAKLLAHKKNVPACILNQNRFFFIVPDGSDINPNTFIKEYGAELGLKGGGPAGFVQGVYDPKMRDSFYSAILKL